MTLIKPTLKLAGSVFAMSALTATAFAADFNVLDANADGQVDFAEYKAVALTEGKTVTLAAQEFTRMAQGDASLTEDEFILAGVFTDQPYALQTASTLDPASFEPTPLETMPLETMPFDPVETVMEVETFESYPEGVEVIKPSVADNEVDELESRASGDIMPEAIPEDILDTTPVEEGEMDLPQVETSEGKTDIQTDESY